MYSGSQASRSSPGGIPFVSSWIVSSSIEPPIAAMPWIGWGVCRAITRSGFKSMPGPFPTGRFLHTRAGRAVALPVLGRDVGRVLVPVPDAGVRVEVAGRMARIERVADPLDRQRLVHEAAMGAVEREVLAAVAPVVRFVGGAEGVAPFVAAVAH